MIRPGRSSTHAFHSCAFGFERHGFLKPPSMDVNVDVEEWYMVGGEVDVPRPSFGNIV